MKQSLDADIENILGDGHACERSHVQYDTTMLVRSCRMTVYKYNKCQRCQTIACTHVQLFVRPYSVGYHSIIA